MTRYLITGKLQVAEELYEFINSEALPGSGLNQEKFWSGFDAIVGELTTKNKELLAVRNEIQNKIESCQR